MKISAIDIRKHTFEKIFRGYDPDEVDAFLNSLSQEWERVSSENSLLKMQLEYSEKELSKLKDIESTLFRTLKAAEDTSRLIEKEANESAEKRIEESRITASDLVNEAENRTNQIMQETEDRLKRFKEDFAAEIKIQERDFKAIENFRDNLIVQLSSLANNTLETVERFEGKYDKESVLHRMEEIKQHVAAIDIPKKGFVIPESYNEEGDDDTVNVVLKDDQPELVFEIAETAEEVKATPEVVEPEPVRDEDVATELPIKMETPAAPEPVATRTAADEMSEALAEMHQVAERARDVQSGVNKFRTQEATPVKKTGGGGSFFDQI